MPPDQQRVPLYEALRRHLGTEAARFHVPGHKGGRGSAAFLGRALGRDLALLDLTELPGLDDLHAPDGVIAEAQDLAAAAFGATRSFFLVNGSTAGVLAMLLASVGPGETVYVPRAMHRSLLDGIILTGAVPVYLEARLDRCSGLPLPAEPGDIARAVASRPGGRVAILVDPTYHGLCADLGSLAVEAGEQGCLLLIDEAHGAHFGFSVELPQRALSFSKVGATVQSLHKMSAALTQGALLHLGPDGLDPERVRAALGLVQTSSPSYPIMASLDLARRFMALRGPAILDELARRSRQTADRLDQIPGLRVLRPTGRGRGLDPLKLTVLPDPPLDGRELAQYLAAEHGVMAETADERSVLFVAGPGTTAASFDRLVRGARDFSGRSPAHRPLREGKAGGATLRESGPASPPSAFPEAAMTPREAFFAPAEAVALEDSLGRISASPVIPAPPGIPILMPGERIDPAVLERLLALRREGRHCQGTGPGLAWVRVTASR